MSNIIVVGAQWGDEGKGKITDILAKSADFVVRSQGGNNAGHTILIDSQELRFHLIPSGILHPHTQCLITGGAVIDPGSFLEELDCLRKEAMSFSGQIPRLYCLRILKLSDSRIQGMFLILNPFL